MAIGTLFGSNPESSGLYGIATGTGNNPTVISQTYFEWFIFTTSAGTPATPTGGSWDFNTNTGTAPVGWTNAVTGVPLNSLWFSIAFVDSRNPTVIVWSTPGLISSQSVYATAYADVFTGNGSTVAWTLTQDPVVVNNTDVSINGVTQRPTTDYTLSGTTLTTTTAAPLNAIILVKYRQALPLSYYGAASNVQFTPVGALTATNVQAAIAEVVTDLAAASGSSLVGFLQVGAGAAPRTTQAKLRETVSVKDFGAVGDGVADDRAAIQACIDYCYTNSKCVLIPNGTYKILDSLVLYDYQVIRGQGWRKTSVTGALGNKSIIRPQYGENPTYAERTIGWDIGEFSVFNTGGAGSIGLNFGNVGYSNVINMGVYNAETGLKCTQRTYYTCFINLTCQANFVCADLQSDGGANEFINANFGFGGGVGNAGVKITSGSWKFNGGTVDTNSADAGWFFKVGENGYPITASLQISNIYVEGGTSAQNVLHFYDNTITTNIFGMERRGSLGPVVYENTAIYDGIYMDSASQPNPTGQFTRRVAFTRNPGTGVIDGGLVALEGGTLQVVAQNLTATGSLSLFNLYLNGGGGTGAGLYFHTANPEGAITAAAGSLCIVNTTGGGGSIGATYKKTGGTGNTGWVAI